MAVALVIIMIAVGLGLIVVELVVLPGITVAGVAGVLLIGGGVWLSFGSFGYFGGVIALIGAALAFFALLIYTLRAKTWKRLSLQSAIDSRVNELEISVQPGDKAITVSRLAPMGKIMIGDSLMEAKSELGLIDEQREVTVVRVDGTSIIVEEKSN